MATNRSPEQLALLTEMRPTDKQWNQWRERRYIKYWCAVLLTMRIHPDGKSRAKLREHFPEDYEIYKERLTVLLRRRLRRKSLRAVADTKPADKASDERVDLHAVARFAAEIGWDGDGYLVQKVLATNASSSGESNADINTPGQRNTFIRYAALVELLRMALDTPSEFSALCKRVDQRLNSKQKRSTSSNERLGALVEESVKGMSGRTGTTPYGFRQGANADEIARAQKLVHDHAW